MLKSKEYRTLTCRIKFISLKITKCILPNLIVYPCIKPNELHLFDGDALCIELQTMSNSLNTLYWGRRKSYQFTMCLLWELISLSPANPVRSNLLSTVFNFSWPHIYSLILMERERERDLFTVPFTLLYIMPECILTCMNDHEPQIYSEYLKKTG